MILIDYASAIELQGAVPTWPMHGNTIVSFHFLSLALYCLHCPCLKNWSENKAGRGNGTTFPSYCEMNVCVASTIPSSIKVSSAQCTYLKSWKGLWGKWKNAEVSSFAIADGTSAVFWTLSWTWDIYLSRHEDLIKETEVNGVSEKCG